MLGAQREIDILSLSNVMGGQDMGYELGDVLKRTGEMIELWQRDDTYSKLGKQSLQWLLLFGV